MPYNVKLERSNGKRTNQQTVRKQVDYIIGRALGGNRGKTWECHVSFV